MTEELSAHRQFVLQRIRKAENLKRMHEELAAAGEPDFAPSNERPNLGLFTTQELIKELAARTKISNYNDYQAPGGED